MSKTIIIIPCLNEARRLPIEDYERYLQQNFLISFCFVNDGSTDKTASILESLRCMNPERVFVVSLKRNCGKSEAVRRGMLRALEEKDVACVAFLDADLSTPLAEMSILVGHLEKTPELDMVFGSRFKRLGASIRRKPFRHVLGRIFATVVSFLLKLPIYDTQCGAKVFRASLARQIFRDPFISRWLFDVEIFGRIVRLYGTQQIQQRLLEMPLNTWNHVEASKLKMSNYLSAPFELFRIKFRNRLPLLQKRRLLE